MPRTSHGMRKDSGYMHSENGIKKYQEIGSESNYVMDSPRDK